MTRLWLTLLVIAVFVALVALMWLGYRNRGKRQGRALPSLPSVPPAHTDIDSLTPELPRTDGVYVCTVTTRSWQDRVAIGDIGFRANASMYLLADGVLIERAGSTDLWIPRAAISSARRERGLAGKVMGTDSILVFRWSVHDADRSAEFDTGFLGDEPENYAQWIDALQPATEHTGEGK